MPPPPHVAVIGAGAFGGWTALHLLQQGARVTLVDAWGAGNPRATSSDESRVLRCGYGDRAIYTDWTRRALRLWKRCEKLWRTELFVPCGVLWLCAEEDDYARASLAALRRRKIPHSRFGPRELARRWPQIHLRDICFGYFEPRSGLLRARLATQAVARAVAAGGGRVLLASAEPPGGSAASGGLSKGIGALAPEAGSRRLTRLRLSGGDELHADSFVFACGPWLPQLFPELLARRIRVTKQEVFYFGVPPGDRRFEPPAMPVWVEPASDFYGLPACDGRGFKIANDRSGPLFDPTAGERVPDPAGIEAARRYLGFRFPALAGAPLVEERVCQYERTPDSHLLIDRHPEYENVWLAGGGSGHGFKLGPAVGEFVARLALRAERAAIPPEMRLDACYYTESGAIAKTRSF